MAALLEFMYKGEVHVSQEALSGFLKSAESLQVSFKSFELYDNLCIELTKNRPIGKRAKHRT